MSNKEFSKVLQELKKDPNYKPLSLNKKIKFYTPIHKLPLNSEILFPYASHNFIPHVIKQCCLCENNDIKSIREIVEDKIAITYYCKEHDPLKNASNRWTNSIGNELVKEINTSSKCNNCNYEITSNKKYKQCKICKSVSKLNYLEECYGLNYKYVIEKRRKTHKRMNAKRQGLNGKIF